MSEWGTPVPNFADASPTQSSQIPVHSHNDINQPSIDTIKDAEIRTGVTVAKTTALDVPVELKETSIISPHYLTYFVYAYGSTGNSVRQILPTGYSDAATPRFTCGVYDGNANNAYLQSWILGGELSKSWLPDVNDVDANTDTVEGGLYIGTDFWTTDDNATESSSVEKNGTNVTISGTAPVNGYGGGALGHDPTNSYLLIQDSTTTVKRYSGISGTTITFVDTITLDTAVTFDTSGLENNLNDRVGFIYDDTNSHYIFLDMANNLIRRFDSGGTTIDTYTYSVDDSYVIGLTLVDRVVYIVAGISLATATPQGGDSDCFSVTLLPTGMTVKV